jgi:gliding motility-associated protein GldM
MALPKEPRQKMINLMYLVLTALLALNVSSEILNAFKVVDKSLTNSNTNIDKANGTLYKSLQEKLNDAQSAEKAKIWEPKAQQAKKLSDDLAKYIDDLKLELKKEAGLEMENGVEKFKEDNLEAATRLFGNGEEGKNRGPELEGKLKAYREAMLAIDPAIKAEFDKTLPVEVTPPIGQDGLQKDFTNGYFHMTPTVAALTILSKFQNNVKNAENQVTTYCHNQIGQVVVRMDQAAVLVGQSSNYVMPGQEITITAGVGAYSSKAAPRISIAGAGVPTVEGVGTYKFQATGGGVRKVPVTVTYLDQNGISKTETKEVEYTVGTPGGAAVMLDKMNVFYIGVPNPVTIGSPSGWDKTSVSMSGGGGSISGTGSNRIVTVSSPGTASITVTADGKTSTFPFRIKTIPDPIIKVGTGSPRMQSATFKAQQYIRADLENFEFDARFSVLGGTVYFSGAGFPRPEQGSFTGNSLGGLSGFINRCQPGSSITIENVKVQGPDGRVRTIQNGGGYSLF